MITRTIHGPCEVCGHNRNLTPCAECKIEICADCRAPKWTDLCKTCGREQDEQK